MMTLPDLPQKPLALRKIIPPCAQGEWSLAGRSGAEIPTIGRVASRAIFHPLLFVPRLQDDGFI